MQNLMAQNTLLVVMAIVLIIWLGISVYLFMIDRKLRKLETYAETHNISEE
jgi:CcmD family protein